MKRYFEFQDSKSYKFWQIELEGSVCTVCYGKIGSAGQQKVTQFDSVEQAEKEANRLIAEKTKKGYAEKISASSKKIAKRIALSYDETEEGKTLLDKVQAWLNSPQAAETEALVIGCWEEPYEDGPQAALDLLCQHSAQLPALRELFVGDMDAEECEISWIIQANYTGLWAAFPNLQRLHIKGSSQLVLSDTPIEHSQLKSLTIECGGLPKSVIQQVVNAKLPALEQLLLYIGVDNYGFDGDVNDLKPLMDAQRFPSLRYLGLIDSELQDDIAIAIASAPVLAQLHTLDLSLGVLTDKGGAALLASPIIQQLQKLDLHYHYLSNEMVKAFKQLPIMVDVSQQQTADEDDWRYPAVTE